MAISSHLTSIYRSLTPSSLISSTSDLQKQNFAELMMEALLNPSNSQYSFESIKKSVEMFFTKDEEMAKNAGRNIFIIGTKGRISKLQNDYYWVCNFKEINATTKQEKIESRAVESLNEFTAAGSLFHKGSGDVTFILSRHPFITPSLRGVQGVDFFLNYFPPVFASQLIPYLEFEFQFPARSSTSVQTPSILKFLLGSGDFKSAENPKGIEIATVDKAILNTVYGKNENVVPNHPAMSFSGMEQFLAPQTLTNMETLKAGSNRPASVKPFLPFASIESFNINVMNAGMGVAATQKATLVIKIHDKSRMSEFSEFLRGNVGFSRGVIWTTYGWVAPRNNENNYYAQFINERMLRRCAWRVHSSNFAFDQTGQVSVTMELLSHGESNVIDAPLISGEKAKEESSIYKLQWIMRELGKIQDRNIPNEAAKGLGIEIRSEQIFSAASTGQIISLDNAHDAIDAMINDIRYNGIPADFNIDRLEKSLKEIYGSKEAGESFKQKVLAESGASIVEQFKVLNVGPDPFLPRQTEGNYFASSLVKAVENFEKAYKDFSYSKIGSPKSGKSDVVEINPDVKIVSFGKLFSNLILPSLYELQNDHEIQVVFYNFNDECGPVSGHSIAEFPIDVRRLAYAYRSVQEEYLRGTSSMSVMRFLQIVIQSQFSSQTAIGYGAANIFKYNPATGEIAKDENIKESDSLISKWHHGEGSVPPFKTPPQVEVYFETGEDFAGPDLLRALQRSMSQKILERSEHKLPIKRIHIYDKTVSPHKLVKNVTKIGDRFYFGDINTASFQSYIETAVRSSDVNPKMDLEQVIGVVAPKARELYEAAAKGDGRFSLPANKDKIKDFLSRIVPNIKFGTNGSLLSAASITSNTDGLMNTINIINSEKSAGVAGIKGGVKTQAISAIPLRVFPGQLSFTTMGCPIANLYQEFFVDFDTGTTLDNLYTCNTITHSFSPGKFTTQWGFIYSDGYGTFAKEPATEAVVRGEIASAFDKVRAKIPQPVPKQAGKTGGSGAGAGGTPAKAAETAPAETAKPQFAQLTAGGQQLADMYTQSTPNYQASFSTQSEVLTSSVTTSEVNSSQ